MTCKLRLIHNACLLSLLAISIFTLTPPECAAQQRPPLPAEYLLPPPLPTPQQLKHQNAPVHQSNAVAPAVAAASAPVPSHTNAATTTTHNTSSNKVAAEPPGFMSRIARWFGLGAAEQNQLANGFSSDPKQGYNYQQQQQQLGSDGKPCNLCNKYPWVPMFQQSAVVQQQQQQQQQHKQTHTSSNNLNYYVQQQQLHPPQQHFDAQASQLYPQKQSLHFGVAGNHQQLPVKQRAVQFNFPTLYKPQLAGGVHKAAQPIKATLAPAFLPLPLPQPNLSLNALPPIFNAQPFRVPYFTPAAAAPVSTSPTTSFRTTPPAKTSTIASVFSREQQLPSTEPARFTENIGAPSELQPDRVRPELTGTATPARDPDPSFEIVKSHQLTDFVSSVEYPIRYEQSPAIDLGHHQSAVDNDQRPAQQTVATASYDHETLSANLHKYVPASQILTELGNFNKPQTQQTQQYQEAPQSQQAQQTTPSQHTQWTQQPPPTQQGLQSQQALPSQQTQQSPWDPHSQQAPQTQLTAQQQQTIQPQQQSSWDSQSQHGTQTQLTTQQQSTIQPHQTHWKQQTHPYPETQYNSHQQTNAPHQPTSQQPSQTAHQSQSQEHSQFSQYPQTYEPPSTTFYTTPYTPQTQYPQHNYEPQGEDNFPSASSHNLTHIQHLPRNQDYKPWLPFGQTFPFTTTEPPLDFDPSTQLPELSEVNYVTEQAQETTHAQKSPSQQSNPTLVGRPETGKQDSRETPKRLLDAPIRHAPGLLNKPRPFTRDPSELNLRIPADASQHRQHNQNNQHNQHNHKQSPISVVGFPSTPLLVTPQPPLSPYRGHGVAADPTPTSTYSAIDASGHYAGISPPTPPPPSAPAQHKNVHQIIIPYTTRNKPRPFEPTRTAATSAVNRKESAFFPKWSTQQNSVDLHEQQESKVVSATVVSTTQIAPHGPPRRTTKYITRILASNIRDLLRREHEVRKNKSSSSSFDLLKLQRNIDDWTEQEYTSLSHRPSTPTIRGRSKHIPTEYLTTTTPSPRRPKTTISFFEPSSELPASINELQALLLERGAQRFELNQIDDELNQIDNRLLDTLGSETVTISSLSSTSRSTTQQPPNSNGHAAPSMLHIGSDVEQPAEPEELWRKAKVSISPKTQEKVYVVTPQPRFFPQRPLTSTTTEQPSGIGKSPRFLVRPTPGNGTNSSTPTPHLYTPELFGLRGLSAYVPSKPVEIIDGNSKVFNLITTTTPPMPASMEDETMISTTTTISPMENGEQSSIQEVKRKGRRVRSTMLPSPR